MERRWFVAAALLLLACILAACSVSTETAASSTPGAGSAQGFTVLLLQMDYAKCGNRRRLF